MNLFKGIKILVVDDDDLLREVMCDVFTSEGADVSEADNGATALTMIQNIKYDVVVSDVRMPGGDGITLAKNISELPGEKPLVFICSGFNDLNHEKADQLNIQKIFEEPFDHKLMIAEVSQKLRSINTKAVG